MNHLRGCVCVFVCVCVRERERERERELPHYRILSGVTNMAVIAMVVILEDRKGTSG